MEVKRFRIGRWQLWGIAIGLVLILLEIPCYFIVMPGRSHHGKLPPLTPAQTTVRDALAADVVHLAVTIGDRNVAHPENLKKAADWLANDFAGDGYAIERQTYTAAGVQCENVIGERPGGIRSAEVVVIGAHYDSVIGTVGANDNGSGVAAMRALARAFEGRTFARTVRFVAFVNEEPPPFQTSEMGSLVYARRCRARSEDVRAMVSLETMGAYYDSPGTQRFPVAALGWFYPDRGNYVTFVGNPASVSLVRGAIGVFRANTSFPSEGAALPDAVPGVGWSDHWSFWQAGYPALMVTDTAPFRYHHYHTVRDTPDKLDYGALARVVVGLTPVIEGLAEGTLP